MQFRTTVSIARPPFCIEPCEHMLFVGSCFADNIGQRFVEERFRAIVNPYGVMYNPASVLHTVERTDGIVPKIVVLTLGTNHVYILNETGEIVDNCQKRPQRLFTEKELTVEECVRYLESAIGVLLARCPDTRIIITVSPIRYAKYGFHGSQLSKATLLLAANQVVERHKEIAYYFPAYEIVNDELRDYRFYAPDMLHPSQQAVDYIYERFADTFFSDATRKFLAEWQPIKAALGHRPFNPESAEYKTFLAKVQEQEKELLTRYGYY